MNRKRRTKKAVSNFDRELAHHLDPSNPNTITLESIDLDALDPQSDYWDVKITSGREGKTVERYKVKRSPTALNNLLEHPFYRDSVWIIKPSTSQVFIDSVVDSLVSEDEEPQNAKN